MKIPIAHQVHKTCKQAEAEAADTGESNRTLEIEAGDSGSGRDAKEVLEGGECDNAGGTAGGEGGEGGEGVCGGDVVAMPVASSPSAESPGSVLNSKKTAQSPTKHGSKRRGQVHTHTHIHTHTHTHTHTH